ncbi:MAG: L-seryl-tRNA(Sec) selenium transferase, partial [bacterium]
MKSPEKTGGISDLLRRLPSVDDLMADLRREEGEGPSDPVLAGAARRAIEQRRQRLLSAGAGPNGVEEGGGGREALREEILREARGLLSADRSPLLRPVINATGVVLHTNLGRAPLSEAAARALLDVAQGYSNLEYDLAAGRRGKRGLPVEDLLRRLTGAEAALLVNNNAAAVMFALQVMAQGREVVVSRGELIEIGGSFRIPDIMRVSGARLVEVGATNKTRLGDYADAIGPETGLLLKAHTSNFRIVGFTEEVSREDLASLGRERGVPVLEDLGSGCLLDIPGIPAEPSVAASVAAGMDVVTFSGDKLLGGPQAGVVVGKAPWVEKMKRHPLMRALRLDKLTLAALEATLRAYLDPEAALAEVPALRMLSEPPEAPGKRAETLLAALGEAAGRLRPEVVKTTSRVGGGALPLSELESRALALAPRGLSADEADARLRGG